MQDFVVTIDGRDYPVNNFSKTYLQGMVDCLSRNKITNVAFLSNSAHVVKKIAVPEIPDTIISQSDIDDDLYVWQIEPIAIAEILLKIALAWFSINIPIAQKAGKSQEVSLYTTQKQACHEALAKMLAAKAEDKVVVEVAAETDKDLEIKRLKEQLQEIKGNG